MNWYDYFLTIAISIRYRRHRQKTNTGGEAEKSGLSFRNFLLFSFIYSMGVYSCFFPFHKHLITLVTFVVLLFLFCSIQQCGDPFLVFARLWQISRPCAHSFLSGTVRHEGVQHYDTLLPLKGERVNNLFLLQEPTLNFSSWALANQCSACIHICVDEIKIWQDLISGDHS